MKLTFFRRLLIFCFPFCILFIYLFLLNPYHLVHAEQMQLFRFSEYFLLNHLSRPGGLSVYIGEFMVQFFYAPLQGTLICIALLCVTSLLLRRIFAVFFIENQLLWIVPVALLTILQACHDYAMGTSIAFVGALSYCCIYTTFRAKWLRSITLTILPVVAFVSIGSFWILTVWLLIIYELSGSRNWSRLSLLFSGSLLIFPIHQLCYHLPFNAIWLSCVPMLETKYLILFVILLLYIPVCLSGKILRIPIIRHAGYIVLTGIPITLVCAYFCYDYKTEKLFEIEYFFYKEDYAKVVALVEKYPGNNHLAVYLGNIALSETLEMGDKLFRFRQIYGPKGLYMSDEPLNVATLYGGALYHHLKYTSEACHWTYNGMVVNGEKPHLLQRLTLYELANANYNVAGKYLNILAQTIHYREWAIKYYKYVKAPLLIVSDNDLANLRRFAAYRDFYHDRLDLQLQALLTLHPDNRAAFNYLIAHTLLKKDMKSFLQSLQYLKEFKINALPLHFEEALLVCKAVMPESGTEIDRYPVRDETVQLFTRYVHLFESAQGDMQKAYQNVFTEFRYTFWFYLDFFPYVSTETASNTLPVY